MNMSINISIPTSMSIHMLMGPSILMNILTGMSMPMIMPINTDILMIQANMPMNTNTPMRHTPRNWTMPMTVMPIMSIRILKWT